MTDVKDGAPGTSPGSAITFKNQDVSLCRKSIDHWNAVRRDVAIMNDYLRQGICFLIDQKFYNYLKTESGTEKSFHAYIGIHKSRLALFCLLDSEDEKLDKDPSLTTAPIYIADYLTEQEAADKGFLTEFPPTDGEITDVQAWQRLAKWGLCHTLFLQQQIENSKPGDDAGVFQVFDSPIDSILKEFEQKGGLAGYILVFVGLRADKTKTILPDLIFWGIDPNASVDEPSGRMASNFTTPRPPFGGLKGYGLLRPG